MRAGSQSCLVLQRSAQSSSSPEELVLGPNTQRARHIRSQVAAPYRSESAISGEPALACGRVSLPRRAEQDGRLTVSRMRTLVCSLSLYQRKVIRRSSYRSSRNSSPPHEQARHRDRSLPCERSNVARHHRDERPAGVRDACWRADTLGHEADEADRCPSRMRQAKRHHRHLRSGKHDAYLPAAATFNRVGHGTFRVCGQPSGHRPLAFGPDSLFGDHVGMHRVFAKQFSLAAARGSLQFEEVEYVDGIENPSESFPNLVPLLRHRADTGERELRFL